jgi:hypothetical protein
VIFDPLSALATFVIREIGTTFWPVETGKSERLIRSAMRARDVIAPLVALLKRLLNATVSRDCGSGDNVDFLASRECPRSSNRKTYGVALLVDIARVFVDFIEHEVADGLRTKICRAIRRGKGNVPADKLFEEKVVRSVARPVLLVDFGGDAGAVFDHRLDTNSNVVFDVLNRRPNDHGRTRRDIDNVAKPVDPGLGRSDLRAFHKDDNFVRRRGAERVHDLA